MIVQQLNDRWFPYGAAKPEKNDVEITAMAEKIRENNQKMMMKLTTQLATQLPMTAKRPEVAPTIEESYEDYASRQGHFGWTTIRDKNLPYLIRSGGKQYVCNRMILEQKIFAQYIQVFTEEVFNCYNIKTTKVTKAEAALLNEINIKHCDNCYGSVSFSEEDLLISLDDVNELKKFFEFCYSRLVKKDNDKQPCGFIEVLSQNSVPYIRCGDITYVPLFYFEGDCLYLEERAINMDGWKLAYLKLACKLQGIRKELFDKPSLKVVDMELVKQFFDPGTSFGEHWPYENKTNHLVRTQTAILSAKPTPTMVQNQQHVQVSQHKNIPVPTAPVYQYSYANAQYSKNRYPKGQPNRATGQMPLTKQLLSQNAYANSGYNISNRLNFNAAPYPVTTTNSNRPKTATPAYTSPASANVYTNIAPNGSIRPTYNTATAYSLYQFCIDNRLLQYCINMRPSSMSPLAVTVEELALFFQVPLNIILDALKVMGIPVLPVNVHQQQILNMVHIICSKGLVEVHQIRDHLRQILYIVARK